MVRQRRRTSRRGRTRAGRLALIDALLQSGAIPLSPSGESLFVDIGFGDAPTTTLELGDGLRAGISALTTVGVEIDEDRVARAQEYASSDARFVVGGFDVQSLGFGEAMLVRCFNVLRGYGIDDVKPAQLLMLRGLAVGGLLIEGSTDPRGALVTAHLWRRAKEGLVYEGLACATDFTRGFSPLMFRDVLPRDLRRHGRAGEPVFDWLLRWHAHATRLRQEARETPSATPTTNADVFARSVVELALTDLETDATWADRGAVIFRPEQPSERAEVLRPSDFLRAPI